MSWSYHVGMVRVSLTVEAARQLASLKNPIVSRVQHLLEKLEQWPAVSGAKPLRGSLKGNWRLRTGDWRIVFRVEGDMVQVWAIDNRRDVYGDS